MTAPAVRVEELWTYPIKSFQGVQLEVGQIDDAGFAHDREFMLVDENGAFQTQRQVADLAKFSVQLEGGILRVAAPGYGTIEHPLDGVDGERVETAVHKKPCTGVDQGAELSAFFSGFLGHEVRLIRADDQNSRFVGPNYRVESSNNRVDFADGFPFLLTSRSSLHELHRRVGLEHGAVPMNRFRPNIVIDAPGLEPFAEDAWSSLKVGSIELFVMRACARCKIPSIIQNGEGAGTLGDVSVLTDFLTSRKGVDLADPDKSRGRFFGQNLVHSTGAIGIPLRAGATLAVVEADSPNIALAA
ncbi:MOSC N-terminal beta barrel domain-containing protein [Candidatus Saccharibacteria bacterium]|nr:MOSC N-terminal beta barrel domain-containing protein [Candidatus Saccharibacteria bacterium]